MYRSALNKLCCSNKWPSNLSGFQNKGLILAHIKCPLWVSCGSIPWILLGCRMKEPAYLRHVALIVERKWKWWNQERTLTATALSLFFKKTFLMYKTKGKIRNMPPNNVRRPKVWGMWGERHGEAFHLCFRLHMAPFLSLHKVSFLQSQPNPEKLARISWDQLEPARTTRH